MTKRSKIEDDIRDFENSVENPVNPEKVEKPSTLYVTPPAVVTQRNYKVLPQYAYRSDLPGETVPDDAYTVREIYTRFAKTGQIPDGLGRRLAGGVYAHEEDIDNSMLYDGVDIEKARNADVTERALMAKQFRDDRAKLESQLADLQKKESEVRRAQLEEAAEIKAEYRRRKAQEARKAAEAAKEPPKEESGS